ncbi:MAG: hypothetical protein ACYS4W_00260 [Planctomycetota bacterium]|jgi:hypothetical protein
MVKRLTILLIAVFISSATLGAEKSRPTVLREGFVLAGVDGKLTRGAIRAEGEQESETWFFEFYSEIGDGRGRLEAGAKLEILPSATLEKMVADAEGGFGSDYRLSGTVTRYRGGNYIFPTRFLPLGKTIEEQPEKTEEGRHGESEPNEAATVKGGKQEAAVNEANDVLAVPQELMERLKTRRTTRTRRQREILQGSEDSNSVKGRETEAEGAPKPRSIPGAVLIDRIGFVQEQDQEGWGKRNRSGFTLDSFGRNVEEGRFVLLPCEALERTERRQAAGLERPRFKIAGIWTNYEGKRYLLLQKAVRVYSHDNFPR